jgi:flagellar basal body-associated protein FliL
MPGTETSEIIFISAMMLLILIVCGATVYFFFKTYAKEKRERENRSKKSEIQNPES